MRQTSIYVGLNDAGTHRQKYDTAKYLSILKTVCHAYRVAFSVHTVEGGYFHDDGSYVEETTLVLTLLEAQKETVTEIAKDLCSFFHQESVMVTDSAADVYFVRDELAKQP